MKAYAIRDPKGNLMVETSSEYIVGSTQAIVLENESEINKIGNLESVFIDVRYYLKHVKS